MIEIIQPDFSRVYDEASAKEALNYLKQQLVTKSEELRITVQGRIRGLQIDQQMKAIEVLTHELFDNAFQLLAERV